MNDKNSDINYFKIGTFVLLGISLMVVALLTFGSSRLFVRTVYIETYFDESIQGISEGSPVKYRGLQIGYVKEMAFASEKYKKYQEPSPGNIKNTKMQARSVYIKIAITSKLFTQLSDGELNDLLTNEVNSGLRIKLSPQGLTGTTYLELNYINPKEHPVPKISWQPENFYMPSVPSVLTQLSESIQDVLQDVRQINLKELFADMSQLVKSINQVSTKMNNTLSQFNEFGGSFKKILRDTEVGSNNLRLMSEQIKLYPAQLFFGGVPPRLDPSKL